MLSLLSLFIKGLDFTSGNRFSFVTHVQLPFDPYPQGASLGINQCLAPLGLGQWSWLEVAGSLWGFCGASAGCTQSRSSCTEDFLGLGLGHFSGKPQVWTVSDQSTREVRLFFGGEGGPT